MWIIAIKTDFFNTKLIIIRHAGIQRINIRDADPGGDDLDPTLEEKKRSDNQDSNLNMDKLSIGRDGQTHRKITKYNQNS